MDERVRYLEDELAAKDARTQQLEAVLQQQEQTLRATQKEVAEVSLLFILRVISMGALPCLALPAAQCNVSVPCQILLCYRRLKIISLATCCLAAIQLMRSSVDTGQTDPLL